MASHGGSRIVFETLLDKKNWDTLTKTYNLSIKNIIRITDENGAGNVLKILLDPDHWNTLTKTYALDIEDIVKISHNGGARNVLDILLDPKNWRTLTEMYNLDIHSIIKLADSFGARKVLTILLNPKNWNIFFNEYNLSSDNIIKIAKRGGAYEVLTILLNPKHWHRLTKVYKLDTESIVNISSHFGSKNVLTTLLDKKNWKLLTEVYKLDHSSIVKIANHDNASSIFDIILDPKNWNTLTKANEINPENIVKIANNNSCKNVFNIILDPKNWKILTKDRNLSLDTIVAIASQHQSKITLEILLDSQKFNLLCSVVGRNYLIAQIKTHDISLQLTEFLKQYTHFSHHFDKEWMPTIIKLNIKDLKGLSIICKDLQTASLNLTQKELLILAKIAGRHLPYIFKMVESHTASIESLFSGYGLPLPKLKTLSRKKLWIFALAELNHYYSEVPLSLEELKFLKDTLPSMLSHADRLKHIKNLISFSTKISPSNQQLVWKKVLEFNWNYNFWRHHLEYFPIYLQKWFTLKGFDIILQIFTTENTPLTFIGTQNQQYLISCLKCRSLRNYIKQTFSQTLSMPLDWTKTGYTLSSSEKNSKLSVNKSTNLTPLDWIQLTILAYSKIETEISRHKKGKKTLFSSKKIKDFEKEFPTFYFHENALISSLDIKNFDTLMKNLLVDQPSSTHNNKKRTLEQETQELPCEKRARKLSPSPILDNDTLVYNSPENSFFSELYLLNELDWQKIMENEFNSFDLEQFSKDSNNYTDWFNEPSLIDEL